MMKPKLTKKMTPEQAQAVSKSLGGKPMTRKSTPFAGKVASPTSVQAPGTSDGDADDEEY
jgi:hypothetical protein